MQLLQREYYIESSNERILGLGHLHHKLATKQAVRSISLFVGKIELGGQTWPLSPRLNLDVIMSRAARIKARDDRVEGKASLVIGVHVPAQAETFVVVHAIVVSMPEIDERTWHWAALTCQH